MKFNKNTILKIFIGLGVIAIGGSAYIQYGKPYFAELSLEKQDQVRIKDLDTLNNIIKDAILVPQLDSINSPQANNLSTTTLASTSSSTPKTSIKTFKKIIRPKAQGIEVMALQNLLKDEGVFADEVTGYMGPVTIKALKDFQIKYNITKPGEEGYGVFGPSTRVKANSLIASKIETPVVEKKKVVYISIPSDDSTCANLDLPSVPDGWIYHCSNQNNYQKTDGTGWIPLNISEYISQLPIDPVNKAETLNYYAYVASSTDYVLTGVLDSKKYLIEKTQNDNGIDNMRYEIGSNLKLWADAEGLVGYWPMNEGSGYVIHDISNKNINGEIVNIPTWTSVINENWLKFDGNNTYVDIKKGTVYPTTRIEFLVRIGEKKGTIISSLTYVPEKTGHDGYNITITPENKISAVMYAKSMSPKVFLLSQTLSSNSTHSIKILFSNTDNRMYVDNILISRDNSNLDFGKTPNVTDTNIGRYNYSPDPLTYFDGEIKNLKIFNTTL